MKIGLLLEGGGMRGLYTAGVLDIFMEKGIHIDEIIGVSAGALFGINYKSNQMGRIVRYNKKYAKNKNYMGMYSLLTTGNIMNEEFCFNKIVNELDPIDYETYKDSKVEFYAVVTNIETGKAEYIKIDDLKDKDNLEYLRASSSMPFVSKPVNIQNKKYLDGGIADSIPIDKMMHMDYDKVIVILTRPKEYRKKKSNQVFPKLYYRKYPKFAEAINHRYQMYNKEIDKVSDLEKEGKIFVIRPSKLVKIKRIEKNEHRMQEMYDLGKEDTIKVITKLDKFFNNR